MPSWGGRRKTVMFIAGGTCIAWLAGSAAIGAPATDTNGVIRAKNATQLTRLAGEVVPSLKTYQDLGPVPANRQMIVAVAMQHDRAAIQATEADIYNPASPNYQHWLTPDEFQARFAASPQRVSAVRSFATAHGMQLYNAGGLGDMTLVSGTAAQAQQTFHVSLHRFRDKSGREFIANLQPPSVPASAGVLGVIGLQNLVQLRLAPLPTLASPADQGQCVGGTCTGILGPQDLWKAYDQPSNNTGQGESIGIIGEGRTDDVIAALRRFEDTRGLPHVTAQVYWTDPGAKTDDSGRVEWELDTQASTGMAPDVSELRLYFGSDLALTTLATTLQTWANDPAGPNQVNASLGVCEDNPALDGLLGPSQTASGDALAQAAMEGRAFFAAAGDTGAGCPIGPTAVNGVTYGPFPTAEYPAADPNATAVGGTVLYTDGTGTRVDEHAWDHSGGTRSSFIAQPKYQTDANIPALQATYCASQPNGTPYSTPTPCRGTVDVSALSGDATVIVAHRGNGVDVQANGYDMVDYTPPASGGSTPGSYNDHFAEGGTSLSSPLWAGMWARVNAAHANGPLGRANDTIYEVAQRTGTGPNPAFFDVTEGANPLPATPGWDFPTGWGTPDVTRLMVAADGTTVPFVTTTKGKHGHRKGKPTKGATTDPPPIQAAGPNYGCPATVTDASGDATSLPQSAPQLDILHADVSPSADGTKVRLAITVDDLSTTVPSGYTSMDYMVYWTNPVTGNTPPATYTHDYYAADVVVDISGGVSYTDGHVAFDDSGDSQYQAVNTVTGTITPGHEGRIEVDVPIGDTGLAVGTNMGTVGAQTAESNPVTGLIVDTATSAADFTYGSPSCLG